MGEAEIADREQILIIRSVFYLYGEAASAELATMVASDIQRHWNEASGIVTIKKKQYTVRFDIAGIYEPGLDPEEVWYNDKPQHNYFRVEDEVMGNISFVDGIGSNTGYFKLDNLLQTSTTAAHEYGHTIGRVHPAFLDIRGMPVPSIMYPRGTICDAHFQYDPDMIAGGYGGCLNPVHRRVLQSDIDLLRLHKLEFNKDGKAIVGGFSSVYHSKHVIAGFQ